MTVESFLFPAIRRGTATGLRAAMVLFNLLELLRLDHLYQVFFIAMLCVLVSGK